MREVVLRGYGDIDEIGQGVVCPFWTPVTLEELVVAVYKCRSYRFEEGGSTPGRKKVVILAALQ